ncbi:hypothetical protein HDU67_001376 [Dinochytrium kinnereticum]|nr:hypothetical protein HDU67_001376 [Dinochytrium kinnereticum]
MQIANLGTDMEKKARLTASQGEEAWKGVGTKIGLKVWRIEQFKVVAWPEKDYGMFYSGDSYIVINTWKKPDLETLFHDIHFWLGLKTSQDEAGTAAYKTVELDDFLGTVPVQHRQVQGAETDLFLSYFKPFEVQEGGVESGFRQVKPEEYRPRLFQVRINPGQAGKADAGLVIREVPTSYKSLNSGDVFIYDSGTSVLQWNGKSASGIEKAKAAEFSRKLSDDRKGLSKVKVFDEGDSEVSQFYTAIGGAGPITSAEEANKQRQPTPFEKVLYRLSNSSGKLTFKEEAKGAIKKAHFDSKDVFVFDTGVQVFVWIGKSASAEEKKSSLQYAIEYLKFSNRPLTLPVTRVIEGGEAQTAAFIKAPLHFAPLIDTHLLYFLYTHCLMGVSKSGGPPAPLKSTSSKQSTPKSSNTNLKSSDKSLPHQREQQVTSKAPSTTGLNKRPEDQSSSKQGSKQNLAKSAEKNSDDVFEFLAADAAKYGSMDVMISLNCASMGPSASWLKNELEKRGVSVWMCMSNIEGGEDYSKTKVCEKDTLLFPNNETYLHKVTNGLRNLGIRVTPLPNDPPQAPILRRPMNQTISPVALAQQVISGIQYQLQNTQDLFALISGGNGSSGISGLAMQSGMSFLDSFGKSDLREQYLGYCSNEREGCEVIWSLEFKIMTEVGGEGDKVLPLTATMIARPEHVTKVNPPTPATEATHARFLVHIEKSHQAVAHLKGRFFLSRGLAQLDAVSKDDEYTLIRLCRYRIILDRGNGEKDTIGKRAFGVFEPLPVEGMGKTIDENDWTATVRLINTY